MRHPSISIGLSNGVNIKWLAEECGTSVAITQKHYAKYIRDDVDKQLARTLGGKSEPLEVHSGKERGGNCGKVQRRCGFSRRKKLVEAPLQCKEPLCTLSFKL
jgi:hypothetical protein